MRVGPDKKEVPKDYITLRQQKRVREENDGGGILVFFKGIGAKTTHWRALICEWKRDGKREKKK